MFETPVLNNKHTVKILALFAIALCVGLFIPRMMAFLPAIIAVICLGYYGVKYQKIIKPPRLEMLFTVVLLSVLGLSALWAPNFEFTIERTIKLSLISLPALFLLSLCRYVMPSKTDAFTVFIIGFHIAVALFLIFEQNMDFFISNHFLSEPAQAFHLNRSYVVFAFIALISHYVCKNGNIERITDSKRTALFIATIMLTLIALYYSISQTAQLSYACGLFFMFLFPVHSKIWGRILFMSIAVLIFILPFILPLVINFTNTAIPEDMLMSGILKEASIIYRFEVWSFTITEINNSLLYGQGIEAQRFLKSEQWMPYQNSDQILHAHNAILQIWLELGVIGALFANVFVSYIYKQIYSTADVESRRLYLVMFTTAFCCAMTGYGLWQSWQVGLFLFFAALSIVLNTMRSKLI